MGRSGTGVDMRAEQVDRLFEVFPRILASRRDQTAGYLSGGERQMLAIAQANSCASPSCCWSMNCRSDLAPHLVQELMEQLGSAARRVRISILLIEQDASVGARDRRLRIHHGRRPCRLRGPSERLCNHKDVQEFYLGSGDIRPRQLSRREAISPQPAVVGMMAILEVDNVSLSFGGIVALTTYR